jgi:hypothetical protein
MKINKYIIVITCFWFLVCGSLWGGPIESSASAERRTSTPSFDFQSISVLEFIFIHEGNIYRIGVTSWFIEKNFNYKVIINKAQSWEKLGAFIKHYNAMVYQDHQRRMDFRYGVVGYDQNGKRIFSLYLDRLTLSGQLDGRDVQVGADFKQWLKETFPRP